MAPIVERREHLRRPSPSRSVSPRREQRSPTHRRSSTQRERSPQRRSSPRTRSPVRNSSSHLTRLPGKEKLTERARSPKHARQNSRSPIGDGSSCSPSPRTKRLRRAKVEREVAKLPSRDQARNSSRDERDMGRNRDRDEVRDKRADREKNDGGFGRSLRHDHSVSTEEHKHRSSRRSSRSPPKASRDGARDEDARPRGSAVSRGDDYDSVAKMNAATEALEAKEKQKPSFELSGKLAEETNRVRGVTLLFTEPPEARKPDIRWRLYVFKAGEVLSEPLYVHRQSCYLFGRERRVADIPTDHPSCSKQHAILQYRLIEKEQADGLLSKQVRPYLMDLDSTNGTFINDNRIEARRYYELFEKDTIKFGNSSREYVLLHEHSAGRQILMKPVLR